MFSKCNYYGKYNIMLETVPTVKWNHTEQKYDAQIIFSGSHGVIGLANGVKNTKNIETFIDKYRKFENSEIVLFSNTNYCSNAKIVKFESFKPKKKAFNMLLGRLWLAEVVLRASKWKKAILCDITDMYFQRNPFLYMTNVGLYYTLEEPWKTLKNSFYGSSWMNCFGKNVWKRIGGDHRMANGGFIGLTDGLVSLKKILYLAKNEHKKWNILPNCYNDQGLLNLAIWTDTVESFELKSVLNDRNELRGHTTDGQWEEKSNKVSFVNGHRVLEPSRSNIPAAIVHHYNRKLLPGVK